MYLDPDAVQFLQESGDLVCDPQHKSGVFFEVTLFGRRVLACPSVKRIGGTNFIVRHDAQQAEGELLYALWLVQVINLPALARLL
jgi:hypothetical protein